MGKKVFTNIVWMLMTGVSSALGAAVYFVYYIHCTTLLMYMVKRKKTLLHDQTVYIYIYLLCRHEHDVCKLSIGQQ